MQILLEQKHSVIIIMKNSVKNSVIYVVGYTCSLILSMYDPEYSDPSCKQAP